MNGLRQPGDSLTGELDALPTPRIAVGLLIGLLFPSFVTWVYFDLLHGTDPQWQQLAFTALKTIQFALPLALVALWCPRDLRQMFAKSRGFGVGAAFGGLVVVGMLIAYGLMFEGSPLAEQLRVAIADKVRSLGFFTPGRFLMLACFYAVVHSFLEEYYWRWFVFRWCRRLMALPWAIGISSVGFALHHVLLLGFYLGFDQWQTYLFSAAVGVGGAVWAAMYVRYRSLFPIWLSHAVVDAGIFALGYYLVRDRFGLPL